MVLDCLDLACPNPVLKTKKALEELDEGALEVHVNNSAAKENVERFATSVGCEVKVEEKGKISILTITKGFTCKEETNEGLSQKTLFLKDDKVGESGLGEKLIVGFLSSILELPKPPKEIICVNRAVFLTAQNQDAITVLKALEAKGVKIYSCGICLEFYELANKLQVGVVGNAYSTVEMLMSSEGVITL